MLRIAVLGCGRIGRMHAANIAAHPRATLAAVYDLHRPAAEEVAAANGITASESAEAIFASAEVDALLIATATDTHVDYIERAVAAGKPVLCEKPIDLSLARANACAAKIRGSGVPIQLGFNRRFDPGHRAARDAVLAGEIGALEQVIITSRDPAPAPRAYLEVSGGIFRDMTIHDFDLARFVLGEEIVEVFATGSRLVEPQMMAEIDDYDSVMVVMKTAGGRLCHVNCARRAVYGYDQRMELFGSAGMLISENRAAHELRRYSAGAARAAEPCLHFFIERYREAYDAEIDAFVDCVTRGVAPEVGFEDGRMALVLAEAAGLSAAEGRVVKVSEVD